MIVEARALERDQLEAEVAIVGAGPAGIVTALELARKGVDTLLIESGGRTFDKRVQLLAEAEAVSEATHAPLTNMVRRQIGGASLIWGGRCVPYDRVDFDERDYAGLARWPVAYDELTPYFDRACRWLRCGRNLWDATRVPELAHRSLVPGLHNGDVQATTLERWSLPTNFWREYRTDLTRQEFLRAITGLTCTEVVPGESGNFVEFLEVRAITGRPFRVVAKRYVLACGGLETTRLMLNSDRKHPGGLGNHSGHLGRWYMSHTSGRIARVHFSTPAPDTLYGYERDSDGVYVRRRLSFTRESILEHKLPNIVGWLVNPDITDPENGNAILSFAFLALSSPFGKYFAPAAIRDAHLKTSMSVQKSAHINNLITGLRETSLFAVKFGYHRFLVHRRAPGFFVYSDLNSYLLQYHGEQAPNANSHVKLGDARDELGMRRLIIDLRFSKRDVQGVIKAHYEWDKHLRRNSVGWLEYLSDDLEAEVGRQTGSGAHQLGTTRMGENPEDGVVDRNLAVHGIDNIFVASSSAFVTSSQANATFMIVAFALRLADHLARGLR